MYKFIKTIITGFCFCCLPFMTYASDNREALQLEINSQLSVANAEVEAALVILKADLDRLNGRVPGIYKDYCVLGDDREKCTGLSEVELSNDQGIVIEYLTGGFVHVTAPSDIGHIAPECGGSDDANVADCMMAGFKLAESEPIFDKHLCLEVHFKDTTEMHFAKPFFTNKTVVLCANVKETGALIDFNMIDDDMSEADTAHTFMNEKLETAWRCFNPAQDLNNGGQNFGYDSDGGKVAPIIDGVLNNCIKVKQESLNDAL